MSTELTTILKRRHVPNCRAEQLVAEGTWDTPWWINWTAPFIELDSRGRRLRRGASGQRWIVAECNSAKPLCPARKLIALKDIEVLAGEE